MPYAQEKAGKLVENEAKVCAAHGLDSTSSRCSKCEVEVCKLFSFQIAMDLSCFLES